jgi:large subunit ribosomal protein L18
VRYQGRIRRHRRARKRLAGTPQRPRLCVFRSLRQISAQVIDDAAGRTLVSASSLESSWPKETQSGNVEGARLLGRLLAERALAAGIRRVVFDRSGYLYHGRVAALAAAAREAGLEF